jgi:hypothetical protein
MFTSKKRRGGHDAPYALSLWFLERPMPNCLIYLVTDVGVDDATPCPFLLLAQPLFQPHSLQVPVVGDERGVNGVQSLSAGAWEIGALIAQFQAPLLDADADLAIGWTATSTTAGTTTIGVQAIQEAPELGEAGDAGSPVSPSFLGHRLL